ncbi:hypothetical protein SAMN02745823_02489 [Sporobacter termitidis DSM 10068]|uniref:DinB superfamily protein n=1 Tax=Sporobacter termitidis DSM 10068 TaxID=1123282 RepID=A0A1M5YFR8_9FIRM|nr:hypothetical protein [Sporobacter termitidis]SHI10885.1 hypothetical protein SAMN02745823_02489 [Sporobacter termitidis DSM 10068]
MEQATYCDIIRDQTARALWEAGNVIDCVPDDCWDRPYYGVPVWKHVYHMLHSLDLYLINPRDKSFTEPPFHEENLNDLDIPPTKSLSRKDLADYYAAVKSKIISYLGTLRDSGLLECPEGCEYTKFTLILAQHRHLHTHMGMLMGFIVSETGRWPRIIGLSGTIPAGPYDKFE